MKSILTTLLLFSALIGFGQKKDNNIIFATIPGAYSTSIVDTGNIHFAATPIKIKPMSIYMMGLNVWFRQNERNIIPPTVDTVYIHVKPKQVRFINDSTLIITK